MKWLLNIVGVLLVLVGLVWILQGVNVLMGSVMSGHILYTFLGILVALIGAAAIFFANRRRRIAP